MSDDRDKVLVEAVLEWWGNCEAVPDDPNDADLMKAIWTHQGDNVKPCQGCEGDCGEVCAPCSVAQAHASLDAFSERWRKQRGIVGATLGVKVRP